MTNAAVILKQFLKRQNKTTNHWYLINILQLLSAGLICRI